MIAKHILIGGMGLLAAFPLGLPAQNTLKFNADANKKNHIAVGADTLRLDYSGGLTTLPVMCTQPLTVSLLDAGGAALTWAKAQSPTDQADRINVSCDYSISTQPRLGVLRLSAPDGTTRDVVVKQAANNAVATLTGDAQLAINPSGTTASVAQDGEGIERSYDGNTATLYHSPYGNTKFPVVLTYALKQASHVDYLVYTPRTDGNVNGRFGQVLIEYTTSDAPDEWKTLADMDFEQAATARRVSFGDEGVDRVTQVRFTVKSGGGNFASCAEMGFYAHNSDVMDAAKTIFTDALCTTLRPGVTDAQINACGNDYVRLLGLTLLKGGQTDFQKKFRIGRFEPYETPSTLAARLKTSNYNSYENPTGIYFRAGVPTVVFAKGIGSRSVTLNVHDFANFNGANDSSYPLTDGINVIRPTTTGNGYVNYYVAPADTATAPDIDLHFALAEVNGYFDAQRGDTNADWQQLLSEGAVSDIIDLRTQRVQVAYPTRLFRSVCPNNAAELAVIIDSVVLRERQILGLVRYHEEPRNRQFARVVKSGMFADGIGAGAADPSGWMRPTVTQFDFWGFAHELGHVNQVRPSFKWTGLGETTNNIYSAWVQFCEREANPVLRLESERCAVYDTAAVSLGTFTGGRFNCYLQQNVLAGTSWQFANGPDYHGRGDEPDVRSFPDEDEDGNVIPGQTYTGPRRNFDHFVKLPPLWQLQLYGTQAGYAPDLYAKVLKGLRGASDRNAKGQSMTNGQQQMRFIRTVCDSTRLNFLPFFEKAGLFRPVKRIIEDYTPGLLNISQKMIDELKAHVAQAGYPTPPGEINYISGLNWQVYKDRLALVKAEVGQGCTPRGTYVDVSADVWKNAVAFETFDADGRMIAISMFGLGHSADVSNVTQTSVLFPAGAKTIKAVGWDGERAECYRAE